MFEGTMIEELFHIVERAEEHAHTIEIEAKPVAAGNMYPGFMAEVAKMNHDWVGAF